MMEVGRESGIIEIVELSHSWQMEINKIMEHIAAHPKELAEAISQNG